MIKFDEDMQRAAWCVWTQTQQASAKIIHFRWSSRLEYETMCSLCSNWWNMELNSVDTTSKNAAGHIKKAFQSWGQKGKVIQRREKSSVITRTGV